MFRWIRSDQRESQESPGLLKELQQHVIHALAPVFKTTPQHPIRQCKICLERLRHHSSFVKEKIPLAYQDDVLSSSKMTRYSMIVSIDGSDTEAMKLQTFFKYQLHCQVNRMCMINYIVPTRTRILSELSELFMNLKINNHLFLYLQATFPTPDRFVAADGQAITASDLVSVMTTANNGTYLWILVDQPNEHFDLPIRYRYVTETDRLLLNKYHIESSLVKIHVLSGPGLAATWVELMTQNRFRMSIFTLLKQLAQRKIEVTFATNYILSARKTFFGFG